MMSFAPDFWLPFWVTMGIGAALTALVTFAVVSAWPGPPSRGPGQATVHHLPGTRAAHARKAA